MMGPSRVRVTGPLERYAAGFVAELVGVGYRPVSAAFQLQLMAHLSRWLVGEGVGLEALSPADVDRFLAVRWAAGHTNYLSPKALAPLLAYLRDLVTVMPTSA